jgi:2-iminoacetate synthase ThiH
VKLGPELSQLTLLAGCNDFGGTLMEESISKSAGADFGEYLPEADIVSLISAIGRIPSQRTTTYGRIAPDGATRPGRGAGWRSGSGAVSPGPVLAS